MGIIDGISRIGGALLPFKSTLMRFIPQPAAKGFAGVSSALTAGSDLLSGFPGGGAGLPTDMIGLINKQLEVQMQMQQVSLYSNIAKSEHETEMAAIRNVRVG